MLRVEKINSVKDFSSLRNQWNDLLRISKSNNMFLLWEWIYNWWRIYGKENTLKILLLKEGETLKGICPFFISIGSLNLRIMRFLGSEGVGSDYLDFILFPGQEKELLTIILQYLKENNREWDIIDITDIPKCSPNLKILIEQSIFYSTLSEYKSCPFLKLPSSWGDLAKKLSRNLRSDLNRKKKKFENDFHGEFIEINKEEDLNEAIDDFIELNWGRMKEKGIVSPFADINFSNFHREIIPIFFKNGFLKMFFMKIDDRPIASIYNVSYQGKYYYYQSGLSPDWNKVSPGMLLFRYSIEKAISEGVEEFDFLQGKEEFKFRWTKDVRNNMRIVLMDKGVKGIILTMGIRCFNLIKKIIKKILKK